MTNQRIEYTRTFLRWICLRLNESEMKLVAAWQTPRSHTATPICQRKEGLIELHGSKGCRCDWKSIKFDSWCSAKLESRDASATFRWVGRHRRREQLRKSSPPEKLLANRNLISLARLELLFEFLRSRPTLNLMKRLWTSEKQTRTWKIVDSLFLVHVLGLKWQQQLESNFTARRSPMPR